MHGGTETVPTVETVFAALHGPLTYDLEATMLILIVLVLFILILVALGVSMTRDMRRMERANRAGQEAVDAWRARSANPPVPPALDVVLKDWGPEHGNERWRWTMWRSDASDEASDLVEGVLVPYGYGNAATRHDATLLALGAAGELRARTGWDVPVKVRSSNPV